MARDYKREVIERRRIDPADWVLLERLEALLRPYLGHVKHAELRFKASDKRGSYDAETVNELRREAETQEGLPHQMEVDLRVPGNGWVTLYVMDAPLSRAWINSPDEAFVNHVTTRITDLFEQAVGRCAGVAASGEAGAIAPATDQAGLDATPPKRDDASRVRHTKRSRLRRFLYDQWVVEVGAGVVVAAIIGLIVLLR